MIFNSFHILLILDVLNSLKLNAKHRCWLLTLHFFRRDPHPKLLPAVNVQQSVTDALFSLSTPTSQHTQPSALCFSELSIMSSPLCEPFNLRLMNWVFPLRDQHLCAAQDHFCDWFLVYTLKWPMFYFCLTNSDLDQSILISN